jgi:hypothetical protein
MKVNAVEVWKCNLAGRIMPLKKSGPRFPEVSSINIAPSLTSFRQNKACTACLKSPRVSSEKHLKEQNTQNRPATLSRAPTHCAPQPSATCLPATPGKAITSSFSSVATGICSASAGRRRSRRSASLGRRRSRRTTQVAGYPPEGGA